MRGLLFHRVDDAEWVPTFGPLSEFAHGAVIYAIMFGFPACLVYLSARQIRAGRKECKKALWWAILMYPLLLLSGNIHTHVAGSRDFYFAWALSGVLGIPWLIYGCWKVVPLLRRVDRQRKEAHVHR